MLNKKHVALLSVGSNTSLIILKVIVGIISGSVSIISEAIHSSLDLVAAFVAWISVRKAENPPDEKHPYGHGKYENVSGVIEAILIIVAVLWIVYEAVEKFISNSSVESDNLKYGVIVMVFSGIVNYIISSKLYKVAKREDSVALEADALHLKTDVYTSVGVGFGLLIIWITKISFLDPVIAILVAVFILREACIMLKKAFAPLVDEKLSDEDIKIIVDIINKQEFVCNSPHEIRSRKSGNMKFIDLHIEMNRELILEQVHNICDSIEEEVKQKMKNTEILIHAEPCKNYCEECDKKYNK
ncbi:MAG: cation diffusion facilitator family transporter [Bacteroidota bacterium]|nr:cation diffusion facilitator family transporter [Bacteroidota bacterium]